MTKSNSKKVAKKVFPIVGIGASAGGLEAASLLLKHLPTNLGMGFVIVSHLDPTHESILANLLSKATTMPVEEVKDNTRVKPNHVYVIPHDKDMTIVSGTLKLTSRSKRNKLRMPIDKFFFSLAKSQNENAVGVILSGTASDGTLGLKAIKSAGGITFAQDATAKYQGMPKTAIASGYVDFVLAPEGIARELSRVNNYKHINHPKSGIEKVLLEEKEGFEQILYMLRKDLGVDFRHYKMATINRRIRRRMLLNRLESLKNYVEYLKDNKGELESLHDDLLIKVTSFFREPQTFQFLRDKIFTRLIKNGSIKGPIRVWVPGCATGEEVYSIAIYLLEFLTKNSLDIPVQIFGTDLSKTAIVKARAGKYTLNDLANMPSKRLKRFFEKTDGVYQIRKFVRELCVFAPHNVFGDPPFSKIDLISCCNLLIYLDISLQDRILQSFHYALKPGGFLMLGKSEAGRGYSKLFSQIEKKYKIYIRKDSATGDMANFRTILTKQEKQGSMGIDAVSDEAIDSTTDSLKEADKILLGHYTPASVVINNDLEIIQFRGSTGPYLEPSQGKPSFNLIKMAKAGLGFEIRSAISKVRKSGNSFKKENVPVKQNAITRFVTIEVHPLKTSLESHYLVLFEETKNVPKMELLPSEQKTVNSNPASRTRLISSLEQELSRAREDMRSFTEEQETINEELQAANEEILSSNEELQSINEELETSKEELESTNEELTTLNEELQNRNEQIVEARNYAEAIIGTVQVALVILSPDMRVKTANRAFCKMFQVNEEETVGCYIYDLGNGQWNIPSLRKLLNKILAKNDAFDNYEIEHNFPSIGHKTMLLNARKFVREGENILLAIEDITESKDLEKQKDLFIGVASHELKTPITTMKGYAQILEKRFSNRGDSKDIYLIQNINRQTDRLTSLINDLLNTSKIQAGKLTLQKKQFDLNAVVTKTIVDFQLSTETHQIIKEGEINKMVYGDQSRIEELLANFITNAIKYSPKADKVIVRLGSDKKNAIVSFQDFGIGIDKHDHERVFERFYRTIDKQEMNVTGFGLGLYIASQIVKAHHGKIWLESTKGKGSTFYFSLPFKKPKN